MAYSNKKFPIKDFLIAAQSTVNLRAKSPLKGVVDLINQEKIAEPLEKGLIRQNYNLTVFRDGTIRYDATNTPLTHFRPKWIGTSIKNLQDLGYTKDYHGKDLIHDDQTVEIRTQDIVIPLDCAKHLIDVSKYVDMELEKIYGMSHFYNISSPKDLLGHLVIGLAPHTSVGITARIIGFTDTQTCFGTPNWHSAKRRDADGDADSIMLYADALLNFSKKFLSDKIGGLMDAPLLIQPLVLPHESQPQAHNLEVMEKFPIEFYKTTELMPKASDVKSVTMVKDRLGKREMYYNSSICITASKMGCISLQDVLKDLLMKCCKNVTCHRSFQAPCPHIWRHQSDVLHSPKVLQYLVFLFPQFDHRGLDLCHGNLSYILDPGDF